MDPEFIPPTTPQTRAPTQPPALSVGSPPPLSPAPARLVREVAGILAEVTTTGPDWADRITGDTRLEDDLWLESVEVTALGELLRQRYGDRVDLPAYLAGLDLAGLAALTVGDLVSLLQEQLGRGGSA